MLYLDREINALASGLHGRGHVPCAQLGRKVRETECCSQVLAADAAAFAVCLACPQGQRLAATGPFRSQSLLQGNRPAEAAPERKPASRPATPRAKRPARPVALSVPTCRKCGCTDNRACPGGCWWVEPDLCSACANTVAELVAAPVPAPAPVQAPEAQPADPRLVKLASALRELTADGRVRVSMLDLMRSLGAANYDEAGALVIHAGLRTSQLSGPVQSVLVDHNARLFMERAASEVRQ